MQFNREEVAKHLEQKFPYCRFEAEVVDVLQSLILAASPRLLNFRMVTEVHVTFSHWENNAQKEEKRLVAQTISSVLDRFLLNDLAKIVNEYARRTERLRHGMALYVYDIHTNRTDIRRIQRMCLYDDSVFFEVRSVDYSEEKTELIAASSLRVSPLYKILDNSLYTGKIKVGGSFVEDPGVELWDDAQSQWRRVRRVRLTAFSVHVPLNTFTL